MRYALPVLLSLLAASATASAADPGRGKALHQQHCAGSCHASITGGDPDGLYTRPNRRVTTLEGLHKQVRRCELSLGLKWFDEDIDNVAAYLNDTFYRFKP
jgi:mono/diheme cytochrome c family protein